MKNEPEKWDIQTWMIPGAPGLTRRGNTWQIEGMQGCFSIPVEAYTAERLAVLIDDYETRRQKKFRRSLRFRWIRFWYLRRHPGAREASHKDSRRKLQTRNPTDDRCD